MKIKKILPSEHIFTKKLADIASPPAKICCLGELPTDEPPVVAIVGSRKPTKYGIEVTQQLAYGLAKRGVVIVSGLALGVDAIAHQAALDAGGRTIAVVSNELPDISPRTNLPLARRMLASGGAIISEWAEGDGTIVGRFSFVIRNRLVSGLSDAVLITEAASRSGTLNTASHALTQGRDIFVVPGNITSPLSEGCNNLLKQGAAVATCVEDILEIISPTVAADSASQVALPLGSTPAETVIIGLISQGHRDGEEIQQLSSLSAADFATALTMLEINGIIKPLGANQWTMR